MSTPVNKRHLYQWAALVVVLSSLLLVPAPILPPHQLAETVQHILGCSWKVSYLVSVIGLQFLFYCSIGMVSALVVKRGETVQKRMLEMIGLPLCLVGVAILIRSYKLGHWPVLIHTSTTVAISACFIGVWIGLSILYERWKFVLVFVPVLLGVVTWGLLGSVNASLTKSTEAHLQRLVNKGSKIPQGEQRFVALVRIAFDYPKDKSEDVILGNRAAILALGIALGDEGIARFVGLDANSTLLKKAALLRLGTTLHEREDWPRHFCVSASLSVLEHPLISDAGGLIKEQLDALTGGSGFSFCDIAADRAGVRFAEAATLSEQDANAMQAFLHTEARTFNFLPEVADLPENLSTEEFQRVYGSVGSESYQLLIDEIELRLDSSNVLSPMYSSVSLE